MKLRYFLLIHFLFAAGMQAMEPIEPDAGYSSDESSFEFTETFETDAPTTPGKRSREDLAQQDSSKKQKTHGVFSIPLAYRVSDENKRQREVLSTLELTADEQKFIDQLNDDDSSDSSDEAISIDFPLDLLLSDAVSHNNPERVKFFLQQGANAQSNADENEDDYNRSLLAITLGGKNGDPSIADLLLHYGADINATTADVIRIANDEESLSALQWLIRHGADLNINDLHTAYKYDNLLAFKALCQAGTDLDLDAPVKGSRSLLHFIAEDKKNLYATYLLEHGANVNFVNNQNNTPLHFLVRQPYEDEDGSDPSAEQVAQLLLYYGADKLIKNKDGKTALQLAQERNSIALQKLLESCKRPLAPKVRDYLLEIAREKKSLATNIAQYIHQRSLGNYTHYNKLRTKLPTVQNPFHIPSQPQEVPTISEGLENFPCQVSLTPQKSCAAFKDTWKGKRSAILLNHSLHSNLEDK